MKVAVGYRISRKGWRVTLLYNDGSEASIEFENFLRAFHNYRKAVLEYLMYVTVCTRNEDIAKEIRAKLTELLLPASDEG